ARTRVLTAPSFIAVLVVLLLNDFVLKPHFHNWLTGKLSDFAGLFIFPLFLSVWAPRFKATIYFSTALAFAFWKSASSQSLLETVNAVVPFQIGRTVDMTDLIALFTLPVSWRYVPADGPSIARIRPRRAVWAVAVSCFCVFAFAATSTIKPQQTLT